MEEFVAALRANMAARGLTLQQQNQALLALRDELPLNRIFKMLKQRDEAEVTLTHVEERLLRWID